MKIWQDSFPFTPEHPIIEMLFTSSTLFLDIETTGFSSTYTKIYMIGCATRLDNHICITQFFAEHPQEESSILAAFLELYSQYDTLITFHGLGFDIPYLKKRCAYYKLSEHLDTFYHIDLFKRLYPLKSILKLENLKQKTLETFLEITREDSYSGKELISIYFDYVNQPTEAKCSLLKLHNYEDVLGMLKLLPALSYQKLFQGNFQVISCEKNSFYTYDNNCELELLLTLQTEFPLPKRISFEKDGIYLIGCKQQAKLKVNFYQGELKYFYPNYKDYYYLPAEDMAIHKSVASYVDKNYRTKATASTCYIKKSDCFFLPQYKELFSPCFKKNYSDKKTYFELTDNFISSLEHQKTYVLHLLQYFMDKTTID